MKLRKWVRVILGIIATISFIIMASDCENTATFILSHLVACAIFALSTTTLIKYGIGE